MKTVTERTETTQNSRTNKGGRPKKQEHRDQKVTVMFTHIEVITVRFYAKEMRLTVSEYLRFLGLKRQVDRQAKALPREVLQLAGTLNHMAANLNQVAHKRNRGDELKHQRTQFAILSKTQLIIKQVLHIRKHQPKCGGSKLLFILQPFLKERNIQIGRDAFFDLLTKNKLLVRNKKTRANTTNSKHFFYRYLKPGKGFQRTTCA
jgi:hypothetical protein